MNEALQLALAKILQSSIDAVSAGVSFLQAEVPDVIQQLLLFQLIKASVLGLVMLVIAVLFGTLLYKASTAKEVGTWREKSSYGYYDDKKIDWTVVATIGAIASGCITPLFFMGFLMHTFTALKIAIAPKLYLIEYAASLVK